MNAKQPSVVSSLANPVTSTTESASFVRDLSSEIIIIVIFYNMFVNAFRGFCPLISGDVTMTRPLVCIHAVGHIFCG